jgi:predicted  nucleic acid-binding Zn-ribbon protein
MEAYVAEPTEEGQDPKTPVQAIAHVMPKSTFLHNVGMQSAAMKRNAKAAAMNDRVNELESELQAEKKGSEGLRSQLADVQKQLEEQKEAARKNEEAAMKNEEETEKLKQQGHEIQGFLRTLFGNKFASPDPQ